MKHRVPSRWVGSPSGQWSGSGQVISVRQLLATGLLPLLQSVYEATKSRHSGGTFLPYQTGIYAAEQ